MSTDKTAPHWPHGTDYPEGGPHAEGPDRLDEARRALAEARAEIALLEGERDDARVGVAAWGRARDVAVAECVALQSAVGRLTKENARLAEERDALRAEVERLRASDTISRD